MKGAIPVCAKIVLITIIVLGICGGFVEWTEGTSAFITAMRDNPATPEKDGFNVGEEFHFIVLSNDNKTIKLLNTLNGNIIGEIGKGNIVFLEKCKIDWCLVSSRNYKGWIDKKYFGY